MNTSNTNALSCKVVLLGESGINIIILKGVGKTSIISRYINNTFQANNMSTTGATFAAKTMYFENHDKNVKFEIWDTAGQEKYRSLTKIFYKDASVAILVYDICRKQSWEDIKNFWYGQLKEQAPKKLRNKSDLYEQEEVEEEKVRAFAKEIDAIFKSTSAKNASGIDDLFKCIGNKFIDPNCVFNDQNEEEKEVERIRKQTVKISTKDNQTNESKDKKCC